MMIEREAYILINLAPLLFATKAITAQKDQWLDTLVQPDFIVH